MRRSLLAGFGIAAVLAVAACAPDGAQQAPLAPTKPSLALSDMCSGSLASQIAKEQKALPISADALADLQEKFKAIKSACPNVTSTMAVNYIDAVIGWASLPTSFANATLFVNHWYSVTNYTTGTGLLLPEAVLQPQGGAAVLSGGEFMTTYDGRARLDIDPNVVPSGPHLYTFDPQPSVVCDGITTLRVTGNCYDLRDYPHETSYTPASTLTFCVHSSYGPGGISHARTGFGDELLPDATTPAGFSCAHTSLAINSWLGREAGPLGRLVAKTYDYLRPRPLFADDAGESGSLGLFSIVGGALTVVYQDGFTANPVGPLANNTDPEIGDFPSSWAVNVQHPGYIEIQNGFGGLQGNVVVLSQALGNCSNCPTTSLLGTRVNPSATDTIGSYEVTWTSLQNKPSVKEAPFVVRSFSGDEIARLSYVSEPGASIFKYNGATVTYNGAPVTWSVDVPQDFKITVNLLTLNGTNSYRTSLAIKIAGVYQTVVSNAPFRNADQNTLIPATTAGKTVTTIGYFLSGIDAGVIAADNIVMKRLADQP